MLYHAYEMTHAAISPMRAAAQFGQQVMRHPMNLMPGAYGSRAVSAALEMFINATRRYGKPRFELGHALEGHHRLAAYVVGHRRPVGDRSRRIDRRIDWRIDWRIAGRCDLGHAQG